MIRTCSSCGAKNRVPATRLRDAPRCGKCKTAFGALDRPVELADPQAFDELVSGSPLPVLVDFWAPWCGPCRIVGPELEKLARDKAQSVVVAKLNTDAVPNVAARYGISGIPTMILFHGGRESKRLSGAMPARAIAQQLGI
jgi:thioredoxin 2